MLLRSEILENYKSGKIHISPFNPKHICPNSYDVTLADTLKVYDLSQNETYIDGRGREVPYLDMKKQNSIKTIKIPEEGMILEPNKLYIGSTVEEIGSEWFIPGYEGRSSPARLGINSHQTAGFGDIGFKSKWTLELSVIHPVKVYAHTRIGQIYFINVNENAVKELYDGKYINQSEPQESLSFLDF